MTLAIVVLAAGLGTRYGGRKQLAPFGPSGEIVLDYTLHDAAAAGFTSAVLVVADGMVDAMAAHLDEFAQPLAARIVVQDTTRATPWGTTHATVVGSRGLTAPFAVANADDVYGAEAIATMATHLRSLGAGRRTASAAIVGYAASATLSPHGGVSRAVCRVDDRGRLLQIDEHTGVRREAGRIVSDTSVLDESTLISMNLWGFDPAAIALLEPAVEHFTAHQADNDRELRLPDLVGELIAEGSIEVTVVPTRSEWLGITYPEDAPHVRDRLAAITAAGGYPARPVGRGSTR
jgi:choline kinase